MTGTVSESVVGSYIFFFHIAFPVNKLTHLSSHFFCHLGYRPPEASELCGGLSLQDTVHQSCYKCQGRDRDFLAPQIFLSLKPA